MKTIRLDQLCFWRKLVLIAVLSLSTTCLSHSFHGKLSEIRTSLEDSSFLCPEYCQVFFRALKRCPTTKVRKINANSAVCIRNCMNTDFAKNGTEQDFILKDTIQCRVNHAKMAIKEGELSTVNHCLHSDIEGRERCVSDPTSQVFSSILDAGERSFYSVTKSLKEAGNNTFSLMQTYSAVIQYISNIRARLWIAYPDIRDSVRLDHVSPHCQFADNLRFRTADGSCNSLALPSMGSVNTSFARNTKPSFPHPSGEANVGDVANILRRPYGKPESDKLAPFNQLATAWIQFMTHDWFQHDSSGSWKGSELRNIVTHWWDASQIYGSNEYEVGKIRTKDGKLILDKNGELEYDEKNIPVTGFAENFWVGLHVFHTIFVREHNFIVDSLGSTYPGMSIEEKYGAARLCVSAILAKIHTLEWTPTILDNAYSTLSLFVSWYGLETTLSTFFSGNILEILKSATTSFKFPSVMENDFSTNLTLLNTQFQMTEEFVAAYRMHPLLPDEIEADGNTFTLQDISFSDPRKLLNRKQVTKTFLQALAKTPARTLSLRNYPYSLYDLQIPGRGKVNLAEIELRRDRERGIPRYNDARRQLLLQPYASLDELTDDAEDLKLLKSVYTDIEQVDFLVGCLADKERPEGFAFGIVPYHIFTIIASSRLYSDRFYKEGLTRENYTPWGLEYLKRETFQSILRRHFPEIHNNIPRNPFRNDWRY